jgi:hypothetical protein
LPALLGVAFGGQVVALGEPMAAQVLGH